MLRGGKYNDFKLMRKALTPARDRLGPPGAAAPAGEGAARAQSREGGLDLTRKRQKHGDPGAGADGAGEADGWLRVRGMLEGKML
jgi:hypothetical protein